jgi:hypothetical protein
MSKSFDGLAQDLYSFGGSQEESSIVTDDITTNGYPHLCLHKGPSQTHDNSKGGAPVGVQHRANNSVLLWLKTKDDNV